MCACVCLSVAVLLRLSSLQGPSGPSFPSLVVLAVLSWAAIMSFRFERVNPRRGDWAQARGEGSAIELKFYTLPPCDPAQPRDGDESQSTEIPSTYFPTQYFGPVHKVAQSQFFTSIQVPHPNQPDLLAWMNVWSCWRGEGVHYAHIVPDRILATWLRDGFQNLFLDLQPATERGEQAQLRGVNRRNATGLLFQG